MCDETFAMSQLPRGTYVVKALSNHSDRETCLCECECHSRFLEHWLAGQTGPSIKKFFLTLLCVWNIHLLFTFFTHVFPKWRRGFAITCWRRGIWVFWIKHGIFYGQCCCRGASQALYRQQLMHRFGLSLYFAFDVEMLTGHHRSWALRQIKSRKSGCLSSLKLWCSLQ